MKKETLCIKLFVFGVVFLFVWVWIFGGRTSLIYNILFYFPTMVAGVIIGSNDTIFSDELKNKLLFVLCFSLGQILIPIIGHFFHHPGGGVFSFAFIMIVTGLVAVYVVWYLRQNHLKAERDGE